MRADWFAYLLLAIYVMATLLYLYEGHWSKSLYFGGSAIITLGIMLAP